MSASDSDGSNSGRQTFLNGFPIGLNQAVDKVI